MLNLIRKIAANKWFGAIIQCLTIIITTWAITSI